MQVTQKEIREFTAIKVTSENIGYLKQSTLITVATSHGIYGVNGILFFNESDGKFYKITSRNGYVFELL